MPVARRLQFPVSLVVALFSLAACAGDEGIGAGNHDPALTVRVTPEIDSLGIGTTTQLSARVTDAAGIQQSTTVAWMSLNNTIATVTANGAVTAVSAGRVGVVATIGVSADTASIVVTQGELIVEPNAVITAVGEQLQFSAATRAGTSAAAAGMALTWTSSDTTVALVDANGNVTAVGAGDAVLVAKAGIQEGSAAVTVRQRDVSSIRITPTASTVYAGAQTQLQATAYDDVGRAMATLSGLKWSSSNTTALTVDDNGMATGKTAGSAVVTVRIGSKSATASVTVLPVPVASVSASLASPTLDAGQTTSTNVVLKDASGNTLTGRTVAFQSSNPAFATVNASGVVAALAKGSVTITAISEGKTGSAALTVAPKAVTSVAVTPNPASATVSQTAQLSATASDAQGAVMTGRTFTWTSSSPSVATVSATGVATAVAPGTTTISATADGVTGTATFSVTAVTAASVQVTPPTATLQVNGTSQLSATAYDAAGNLLSSRVPTWASANPTVATVSNAGRVTAVSQGSTMITATVDGKSATAAIGVDAPPPAPVATVNVTLGAQSLSLGQTTQASAVLRDASNNTLSGRSIAWSSAAPQLATVSASGVVTAVAAGSATIIATSEGQSGSATLVVSTAAAAPVATVSLSATSTSLYVGQSQQLTVALADAFGHVLSGRTIAWSSSSPSVVTVSPSGQVQAMAVGSATITATSEGKSGSITITVTSVQVVTVSSVSVSASATSVLVGQTAQLTATPKDSRGVTLTGRTVSWSSSAPSIAAVSSTGVVTGAAAGTAVINASVEGVVGSSAMTITNPVAPPPPPPVDPGAALAAVAELPRSVPSLTFGKATRVINVNGGDLQAALDAAQHGDSLVLSGTFVGNFMLPSRPCGAGITITSAAALPPAGTRITPAAAAGFAKILTPNVSPALKTKNPTCGWRIVGVEIAATPSAGVVGTSVNYGLVWLGDGGWLQGGDNQVSLAQVPQNFLLDRVYLHGLTTTNSMRCLYLNTGATIIRDSWISECHADGFDAQAILGCNGPGPYLIENNDIQGSTEVVMFGGCDPAAPELIPSDITMRRNYIHRPDSWKGVWLIKNLFELKNARRVLVEDNVFENNWIHAQMGMAWVIKSSTETCSACTWEGTKDVTMRYNLVRFSHRGLNIQAIDGSSAGTTASHTERINIHNNLFTDIGTSNGISPTDGWLMLLTHDLKDILIRHNTFIANTSGYGFASYFGYGYGTARRIEIVDNLFAGQSYYALGSDNGLHANALNGFAGTSWRFAGNAVSQIDQQFQGLYPANNTYTDRLASLGLAADGSLSATSTFRGRATDATNPGANVSEVVRRTQGVVIR